MSCPTLPFFSVRDRTIGVGLCDNLATDRVKISFTYTIAINNRKLYPAKLHKIFSSAYKVV